MNRGCVVSLAAGLVIAGAAIGNVAMRTRAAEGADPRASSYMQVTEEDFRTVLARMRAAKAGIEKRQQDLLVARYDLADRPVVGTTMSRGKPVQGGVRVKLPTGVTWDALAKASADEIQQRGAFPQGFMPLPHPNHPEGGMGFPKILIGDIRPQEFRHRIETPSLRGVNVQRLFGSQRALKTVEDFTEFEQRAAYFDGDPVIATKKGVNVLERGSQVHFMGEFQEILDFPPAPKLDVLGKLDPKKATTAELRGQTLFFGKGQCATCHVPPYYTDNSMHNLRAERFYKPQMINGMMAAADGPIKTFPLRGIKDTPPYLHDGRLLTLDDTVEFFNLTLGTQLTPDEKRDLVAFLRAL